MTGYTAISSEFGWIGVALSARGVRALTLPSADRAIAIERACASAGAGATVLNAEETAALEARIGALLAGESHDLGIELDPLGTPFQRAVWDALVRIPRGETLTYGTIAEMVGRPGAARAVGQAVGANPLPLVIPCHRVIGANGGAGGFAGGIPLKRALLAAEGVAI